MRALDIHVRSGVVDWGRGGPTVILDVWIH